MPLRPDHHIDAGAAAEAFAHRHRQRASIQMGIGFGLEAPVAFAAEIGRPLGRVEHALGLVASACLEKKHPAVRIFGEAAGDYRSGGSGAADDEVISLLKIGGQARLVLACAALEVSGFADIVVVSHRGSLVLNTAPQARRAAGRRRFPEIGMVLDGLAGVPGLRRWAGNRRLARR